jgi:hypothetical protein
MHPERNSWENIKYNIHMELQISIKMHVIGNSKGEMEREMMKKTSLNK